MLILLNVDELINRDMEQVPLDDVATAHTVVDLVSLFATAADEHDAHTFFDRVA